MAQTPLPANELKRLAALASYNILDTMEEKDFDDITLLASEICNTPISLISLLDEQRQWFKSHTGLDARETGREHAFCAHAITGDAEIFIVNDATKDPRFADNPLVKGHPNVSFYAGVPLITDDGYALGSLCVIDHEARELTAQQISALKVLSKQVLAQLELRRKLRELEDTNKRLLESNAFIQKFAATVAHDIKNPLSSMLLSAKALQQRIERLEDTSSLKLVNINIDSGNKLLKLLDEMLAYSKSPATLLQNRQVLQLNNVVREVVRIIDVPEHVRVNLPAVSHRFESSHVAMQQIFLNLFTNAIRYNDKDEIVIGIGFEETATHYAISVSDNGIGIDEKFHELIFENNVTMNQTDRFNQKGTGIGLATVKSLINHMKGEISLTSAPGQGTTFHITFPK